CCCCRFQTPKRNSGSASYELIFVAKQFDQGIDRYIARGRCGSKGACPKVRVRCAGVNRRALGVSSKQHNCPQRGAPHKPVLILKEWKEQLWIRLVGKSC